MDLDISILVTIVLYEELGKNQSDCKCVEAKRDGMRVQTRKFSKTNPQLIFVSPIDRLASMHAWCSMARGSDYTISVIDGYIMG